MAGEDFSYFGRLVPSTFIHYGGGNTEKGLDMPLHSSKFAVDEDCIKIGMMVLSQFALDFGEKNF